MRRAGHTRQFNIIYKNCGFDPPYVCCISKGYPPARKANFSGFPKLVNSGKIRG